MSLYLMIWLYEYRHATRLLIEYHLVVSAAALLLVFTMSDSANLVDCSSSASVWSMPEAIRNFTCMFSNIQIANGLLDVDGPFRVQPTECFYEASGSFAPTRRIIFYVLLLLSTCFRRKYFISGVCMGIIMSYSTVAHSSHHSGLYAVYTDLCPN
jgi:membrane-associated PAP2 superfamily phosphatase